MVLTDVSGKDHAITQDLNFHNNRYEVKQVVTFKNPKAPLLGALRGSGPVPGDTAADAGVNGASSSKKRQSGANEAQKRKKPDTKGIDMDRLAEGLQKLGEDDLLQVVQMVHDNKSEESWMRNDVDRECFHPCHFCFHQPRLPRLPPAFAKQLHLCYCLMASAIFKASRSCISISQRHIC